MYVEMKDVLSIDGNPAFLYGGEIHYFRIPISHWRERLNQAQALGITVISTYIPWIWHEIIPGHYDFTGQSHPQRNLVQFMQLARDMGFLVFVRPGPYVMAELKNEGLPSWLLDQHPEIIARDGHGNLHPTRMVSYLHPMFLSYVEKWYQAVAETLSPFFRNHGGPIVMTQLDNEVGMLHWVSGIEDSQERPTDDKGTSYWTNAEFWRDYRYRYLKKLSEIASHLGFPTPYVVNVHGFRDFSVYSRGVDFPLGLSQLLSARKLPNALIGGDFYPGSVTYDNFHDMALAVGYTRAVNGPNALAFSPEFQSGRFQDRPHLEPSDLDLSARVAIAYGLNGINWYMLAGGENPEAIGLFGRYHDWQAPISAHGELRESAQVIQHLGKQLSCYAAALVRSRPLADLHIGFYSRYYMTENNLDNVPKEERSVIQAIVEERELWHFDGLYRTLVAASIPLAVTLIDGEKPLNPTTIPWLWIGSTRYMDDDTQATLAQYVREGGHLIVGPSLPQYDLNGHPSNVLQEALALPAPCYKKSGLLTIGNNTAVFTPAYAVFDAEGGAQVIGHRTDNPRESVVAKFPRGKGSITFVGVALPAHYDYYQSIVQQILEAAGLTIRLRSSNSHIHAACRVGSQGNFLFVHNFHDTEQHTGINFRPDFGGEGTRWDLTLLPRQGVMLPFGGVSVVPNVLRLLYTTAEISWSSNQFVIHRSKHGGTCVLERLTDHQVVLDVVQGHAAWQVEGSQITISWPAASTDGPVCFTVSQPVSITPNS